MSGIEARLAEVLAEHALPEHSGWNGDAEAWCCTCGEPYFGLAYWSPDLVAEEIQKAHRSHVAATLTVVVAEGVTAARAEALGHARAVIPQYLSTAEKWRYDRVCWAFAIMLGEIPEDSPAPLSPGEHDELARLARAAAPPSSIGSGMGGQGGVGLCEVCDDGTPALPNRLLTLCQRHADDFTTWRDARQRAPREDA